MTTLADMTPEQRAESATIGAKVVPAPAEEWDTTQPLMVECIDCGIEWGWTRKGTVADLQLLADRHNEQEHPRLEPRRHAASR